MQDLLRRQTERSKCIIGGTPADPVARRNAESEESKKQPKSNTQRCTNDYIYSFKSTHKILGPCLLMAGHFFLVILCRNIIKPNLETYFQNRKQILLHKINNSFT